MFDYLSFWFAKFVVDLLITIGFIAAFMLFYLFIYLKHGYKKKHK